MYMFPRDNSEPHRLLINSKKRKTNCKSINNNKRGIENGNLFVVFTLPFEKLHSLDFQTT